MNVYFIRHGESENNVLHDTLRDAHEDKHHADSLFGKQRHYDPPLTLRGLTQVELVATRLLQEVGNAVDEIWVSFLSRALGTADALHRQLPGASVLVMPDINEKGGSYCWSEEEQAQVAVAGSSRRDVSRRYPLFSFYEETHMTSPTFHSDDAGWYALNGKETPEHCRMRAMALVERIERRATRARLSSCAAADGKPLCIAIVTHGDFFKEFIRLVGEQRFAQQSAEEHGVLPPDVFSAELKRPSDSWVQNTSVTHFVVTPRDEALSDGASHRCHWELKYFADASHLLQQPSSAL